MLYSSQLTVWLTCLSDFTVSGARRTTATYHCGSLLFLFSSGIRGNLQEEDRRNKREFVKLFYFFYDTLVLALNKKSNSFCHSQIIHPWKEKSVKNKNIKVLKASTGAFFKEEKFVFWL